MLKKTFWGESPSRSKRLFRDSALPRAWQDSFAAGLLWLEGGGQGVDDCYRFDADAGALRIRAQGVVGPVPVPAALAGEAAPPGPAGPLAWPAVPTPEGRAGVPWGSLLPAGV